MLDCLYENFVAGSEGNIRAVSGFLALPYPSKMADFHEGKTRDEPALEARKAWLPTTRGVRDWRGGMSGRDIEHFEVLAGDVLDESGCERGTEALSPGIEEVAEKCLSWWNEASTRKRVRVRGA